MMFLDFSSGVWRSRHHNSKIYPRFVSKCTVSLFFIYFVQVYLSPQHDHNWLVELQSQNRGYRDTRLCPYNVFNSLRYIPCLQLLPVSSYRSASSPCLPSSLSTSVVNISCARDRSRPSCSHHILATYAPRLCTVFSQRSRIGPVAIYCTTAFYLFKT